MLAGEFAPASRAWPTGRIGRSGRTTVECLACRLTCAFASCLEREFPLRRFADSSGTITVTGDQITVRVDRRAYSPVLRQASLPPDTTVPWWHGRRLHFEFS